MVIVARDDATGGLYRAQAYAFTRACSPALPDGLRPELLPCPICLRFTPANELTVEHAPPRWSQLGERRALCLTCGSCNNERAFESKAAVVARRNRSLRNGKVAWYEAEVDGTPTRIGMRDGEQLELLIDDTHGVIDRSKRNIDLRIRVDEASVQLLDLKAAYLIAFASLGYSWALSPELAPVRSAILDEDLCQLGLVVGTLTSPRKERAVVATSSGDSRVGVVGENGDRCVVLPPAPPRATVSFDDAVDWPNHEWWTQETSSRVFHWDVCAGPHPRTPGWRWKKAG